MNGTAARRSTTAQMIGAAPLHDLVTEGAIPPQSVVRGQAKGRGPLYKREFAKCSSWPQSHPGARNAHYRIYGPFGERAGVS
jgi:hypothetical protein